MVVEHGLDPLDQEAEGVEVLKRLVDLHEGHRDQHEVHYPPLASKLMLSFALR